MKGFMKAVVQQMEDTPVINFVKADNFTELKRCVEEMERDATSEQNRRAVLASIVNERDSFGRTPMHYVWCATGLGVEVVGYLKNKGADINAVDRDGNTPLHTSVLAFLNKSTKISLRSTVGTMNSLLMHGAHPGQRNTAGSDPLSYLFTGTTMKEVVKTIDTITKSYESNGVEFTWLTSSLQGYAELVNKGKADKKGCEIL